MNYRMTQEFKPPFKVYPVIEEKGPFKVPYIWLCAVDQMLVLFCFILFLFILYFLSFSQGRCDLKL